MKLYDYMLCVLKWMLPSKHYEQQPCKEQWHTKGFAAENY